MEKAGTKTRDIQFFSGKNQGMVLVHSRWARDFAKYLEEQSWVESYEAGILNSSSVIPVVGGNIYYHVLVASPATLFPAAPGEVQQLLEVLGGREPDSTPLLQAMSQVEVRWMWMDNLRRHRKESFARGYADAISAGLNIFSAAEVGMKCEEVYEEGYVEEKLEQINNVPHRIQAELSIEAIANSLEVPVEVVKGVLEGKVYTEEDFRKMYGRGK